MEYRNKTDYFMKNITSLTQSIHYWPQDLDVLCRELISDNFEKRCGTEDDVTLTLGLKNITYGQFDDQLEELRNDAYTDFKKNGIEAELDHFDMIQAKIRGQNFRNVIPYAIERKNDKVLEYMVQKERKKGKQKICGKGRKKVCVFCKNNGEQPSVYSTHVLKDDDGKVTCPILRRYTCPVCGVSGDYAHTIKYCPLNDGDFTTAILLKTARQATGKKRKVFKC